MLKSHAEMQRYHYRALAIPQYQLEGIIDCFREEMSFYQPYIRVGQPPEPQPIKQQSYPADGFQQLQAQLIYLGKKVHELQAKKAKKDRL